MGDMVDAQLTAARVLKPFSTFKDVYQGKSSSIPIAFPGGLDPRAGQNGIAPNLARGLKMPIGARVCVWIPVAVYQADPNNPIAVSYDYSFHWRLRNVADFRQSPDRPPYHFPRQSPGAPDTSSPVNTRVVIPAANDVIIYEQPQPAAYAPGVMRVFKQTYQIGDGGGAVLPLLADGSGSAMQQGVLDPALGATFANGPIFQPLWMDALGDELIILATRTGSAGETWDFTDPAKDLPFWNIYGGPTGVANPHPSYPDLGITVMQGSAP